MSGLPRPHAEVTITLSIAWAAPSGLDGALLAPGVANSTAAVIAMGSFVGAIAIAVAFYAGSLQKGRTAPD
jgi:hypothetical protein